MDPNNAKITSKLYSGAYSSAAGYVAVKGIRCRDDDLSLQWCLHFDNSCVGSYRTSISYNYVSTISCGASGNDKSPTYQFKAGDFKIWTPITETSRRLENHEQNSSLDSSLRHLNTGYYAGVDNKVNEGGECY